MISLYQKGSLNTTNSYFISELTLLNVVCILKTNLTTKQQAHVLVFSSDLTMDAEKMIDYYALRFQIEFNFRDAKQYWGGQDFMNVNKIPVNNAVNLAMFMVSVRAKLTDTFRCENTEFSVLDLKARYRGRSIYTKH